MGIKSKNPLIYFFLALMAVISVILIDKNTNYFWTSVQSRKAQFQFKIPRGWFVDTCPDLGRKNEVFWVSFKDDCVRNMAGKNESYNGYIHVLDIGSIDNEISYLDENYQAFLGTPVNMGYGVYPVGDTGGYTRYVDGVPDVSGPVYNFYVFANNKLYEITIFDTDNKTVELFLSGLRFE